MHLDFIVGKKALSLVVINIIVTYSGGSSNVFSNAFCASFVIFCPSFIIYTFFVDTIGFSTTFLFNSLICSIFTLFPSGSIIVKSGLFELSNSKEIWKIKYVDLDDDEQDREPIDFDAEAELDLTQQDESLDDVDKLYKDTISLLKEVKKMTFKLKAPTNLDSDKLKKLENLLGSVQANIKKK